MLEVHKDNFDEEVLQADGIVFVDFWSPKCESCLAAMPEVEALAERLRGKVKFCKLDTSGNRRLAISQKVMGLPTFIIYKDGEKAYVFDSDAIDSGGVEEAGAKLDELLG